MTEHEKQLKINALKKQLNNLEQTKPTLQSNKEHQILINNLSDNIDKIQSNDNAKSQLQIQAIKLKLSHLLHSKEQAYDRKTGWIMFGPLCGGTRFDVNGKANEEIDSIDKQMLLLKKSTVALTEKQKQELNQMVKSYEPKYIAQQQRFKNSRIAVTVLLLVFWTILIVLIVLLGVFGSQNSGN